MNKLHYERADYSVLVKNRAGKDALKELLNKLFR
jgi:hypothetical protein